MIDLSLYIKESILEPEDDLVNSDIDVDGIYVHYKNGNIIKACTLDGNLIDELPNNDVEAILINAEDKCYALARSGVTANLCNKSNIELTKEDNPINKTKARADMNGEENTKHLLQKFIDEETSKYITSYKTPHIKNWYIPSAGELLFINRYYSILRKVMQMLGNKVSNMAWVVYWSSTISDEGYGVSSPYFIKPIYAYTIQMGDDSDLKYDSMNHYNNILLIAKYNG